MLHVTFYMLNVKCYMLHVTSYMLNVSLVSGKDQTAKGELPVKIRSSYIFQRLNVFLIRLVTKL